MTIIEPAVLHALTNANQILCISHINPDGDAVGSLLGMGWLLRHMGKQPTLALQDAVPHEHQVLPAAATIITAQAANYRSDVQERAFDLVISLDGSSPDRMGNAYNSAVHGQAPLLVIDHHITNTFFGDINWVAPECAATCQMLAYLADALQVPLTGELAECLLTGLVTDTLCFRTSNTTPAVLEVAQRLMQGGASLVDITQRTLNRQPFAMIKLWSLILPTIQLEDGVIWAAADQPVFAQAGLPVGDTGLSSYLVTADEAAMSAVFVQKQEPAGSTSVECSFRAKPRYNVAQLALSLGGGGHPAASGCTLAGTLAEVVPHVVGLMKTARREQDRQLSYAQ
ncbi:MAG: bifunctional oligoribonuclease/PAP phosphatase NrnA [Caldilineaceae bacterium]|nr:bifunctional oligoribonuclease/PAP phosphatase NrnA [Caldilineaceae bacterium]